MRTTIDIDEDVLGVAKQLAAQRNTSTGKVLSELARQALKPKKAPRIRNGVLLFEPAPGPRPSLERMNRWRDGEE